MTETPEEIHRGIPKIKICRAKPSDILEAMEKRKELIRRRGNYKIKSRIHHCAVDATEKVFVSAGAQTN